MVGEAHRSREVQTPQAGPGRRGEGGRGAGKGTRRQQGLLSESPFSYGPLGYHTVSPFLGNWVCKRTHAERKEDGERTHSEPHVTPREDCKPCPSSIARELAVAVALQTLPLFPPLGVIRSAGGFQLVCCLSSWSEGLAWWAEGAGPLPGPSLTQKDEGKAPSRGGVCWWTLGSRSWAVSTGLRGTSHAFLAPMTQARGGQDLCLPKTQQRDYRIRECAAKNPGLMRCGCSAVPRKHSDGCTRTHMHGRAATATLALLRQG